MTNCDLRPDVTGDCKVDTQDLLLVLGAVDQSGEADDTSTSCASIDTCTVGEYTCAGPTCTAGWHGASV